MKQTGRLLYCLFTVFLICLALTVTSVLSGCNGNGQPGNTDASDTVQGPVGDTEPVTEQETDTAPQTEPDVTELPGTDEETDAQTVEETVTEAETYAFGQLSPDGTEPVVLIPDDIYAWYGVYDSQDDYFSSFGLQRSARNNYPVPVTFAWEFPYDEAEYTLTYGLTPDLSDGISKQTKTTSLRIHDLLVSTTYYWRVTATVNGATVESDIKSFTTADTMRLLEVTGLENARDMGGRMTCFGIPVKQGVAFRTGKLDDLSEKAISSLNDLYGIRTELDLRYAEEVNGRTESFLGPQANYISIPSGQYFQIYTNAYPNAFKNALLTFTDADNYPVLMHCSVGCDRTGTLAAFIYALCGVDEVSIVRDYELSFLKINTNVSIKFADGEEKLRMRFLPFLEEMKRLAGTDDLRVGAEYLALSLGLTEDDIHAIRRNMLGDGYQNAGIVGLKTDFAPLPEQDTPVVFWEGADIVTDLIARSVRENLEDAVVSEDGEYVTVTASGVEGFLYLYHGTTEVSAAPVIAVRYRTSTLNGDSYFETFLDSKTHEPTVSSYTRSTFTVDGEWHTLIIDLSKRITNFNGYSAKLARVDLYNRGVTGQTIDYSFIGFFTSVSAAEAYMADR